MKKFKIVLVLLLIALLGMQFVRPAKNISTEVPATDIIVMEAVDEQVAGILKTACYDCHSNNTVYPWYSEVAPLSYWITHHVNEGKEHLDFSRWGDYSSKRKAHKMEELVEMVEEGEMPLKSYTWIHGESKLSEEQISLLTEWAKRLQVRYELDAQAQ